MKYIKPITISPKLLKESNEFIENIEDMLIISDDDSIYGDFEKVYFDLLTKSIEDSDSRKFRKVYQQYYGNLTNADILQHNRYKMINEPTIVEGCLVKILIDGELNKKRVKEMFNRIINFYPNILIFGNEFYYGNKTGYNLIFVLNNFKK